MAGPAAEAFFLLGASILAGYVGQIVFRRFRVSDIIVLLAVGFTLGPLLGLVDAAWLRPAMPILAPLGLVIILFEGGLELRWEDLRKHAAGALLFAVLSWLAGGAALFAIAHYVLGIPALFALMFAAAAGATGIVAVIPILAQIRAPAKARVWLTAETGIGDLLSAVAVTGLATLALTGGTPLTFGTTFGARTLLGAAIGFLGGLAWARGLFHVRERGPAYALTLGALLVAYAVTEALGGSGYFSALVFGLVVGNAGVLTREGGVPALASLTERSREKQTETIFLLRSLYFIFLGMSIDRALFAPATAWTIAALVGALLAARVLVVGALYRGPREERTLMTGMMPRAMAVMVLAATPAAMGVAGAEVLVPLALLVVVGSDVATTIGLYLYERRRARVPGSSPASIVAP